MTSTPKPAEVQRIKLIEGDRVTGHWPEMIEASHYDSLQSTHLREVGALIAQLAAVEAKVAAYEVELTADIEAFKERDRVMEEAANNTMRLIAERDAATARARAAERDAARYRWLREHWNEPEVAKLHPWDDFSPDPDQLDTAIDAHLTGVSP